MLIVTETMFVRTMLNESPVAFSEEALKLIYQHYCQEDVDVDFRVADVELAFNEESYFECVENNDIPLEGLEKASSEYEKTEFVKRAIAKFLESANALIGFTTRHTVVYKTNW